jgi:hypothetical protein
MTTTTATKPRAGARPALYLTLVAIAAVLAIVAHLALGAGVVDGAYALTGSLAVAAIAANWAVYRRR